MRGSPGRDKAGPSGSASTHILLNLLTLNRRLWRPTRTCLYSTGPGESSRTASAIKAIRGDSATRARPARKASEARFILATDGGMLALVISTNGSETTAEKRGLNAIRSYRSAGTKIGSPWRYILSISSAVRPTPCGDGSTTSAPMPSSEHSSPTERPRSTGRPAILSPGQASSTSTQPASRSPERTDDRLIRLSLDSLSADAPITRVFTTYRPRFILRAVRVVIQ